MRRAGVAVVAVALLLTGCSSSSESGASASASASPSPTPTPPSVVWAGGVCTARDRVKASITSLGQNLNYDVTSDRSAVEQIDRQLRIQVLAVGDAIDKLNAQLATVPVDFAAANEVANTLTKAGSDTKSAVTEVRTRLDAAVNAGNFVEAGAQVAAAVVAAKAAYEAGTTFVSALGDATSQATGDVKVAFDAAPECQG